MIETEKSQAISKVNYDKHHKIPRSYKVGEYVMLSNVDTTIGVSKKLIPKYRGPFIIKSVLPNNRYVLNDVIGFQNTRIPYEGIIESSRLKPYYCDNVSENEVLWPDNN